MVTIDHDIDINKPPRLVWRALVEFENYKHWNRFTRFTGSPAVGAELEYRYLNTLAPGNFAKAPVKVSRLDQDACFEWRTGIPYIFDVREGYELTRTLSGTCVRHYAIFTGAMSWIMLTGAKHGTFRKLRDMDVALAKFLQWKKR